MLKENNTIELTDLTVASVEGEDAKIFLQGQLSQDLSLVNEKTATLAAYCTAKGRVLATMVVLQKNQDGGYLLLTKADNAMAFVQRLRMFVLRAKVDIQITNTKVYGTVNLPLENKDNFFTDYTFTVENQNDGDNKVTYISAPSANDDLNRCWVLSQQELSTNNANQTLDNTDIKSTLNSIEQWQSLDIQAGLPWVIAANQDVYIPQTLNFDLINGVSFTKGCYPGQEVVARSHYRGTIKRRCAYASVNLDGQDFDNNNLIGSDIFNADKPKNPCGRVINAVIYSDKIFMLIEVQLSDVDTADFRLQEPQGLKINLHDLPYSITSED